MMESRCNCLDIISCLHLASSAFINQCTYELHVCYLNSVISTRAYMCSKMDNQPCVTFEDGTKMPLMAFGTLMKTITVSVYISLKHFDLGACFYMCIV